MLRVTEGNDHWWPLAKMSKPLLKERFQTHIKCCIEKYHILIAYKDGESTEIPGSDDSASRIRLAEACVRQTASSIPVGFGRFGKGRAKTIRVSKIFEQEDRFWKE